jgi:hypothetical protein
VPAAAVIPAPIAYIKVVAVKKLVVGFLPKSAVLPYWCVSGLTWAFFWRTYLHLSVWCCIQDVYFEKIRVFQAGIRLEYSSME